MKNVLEIIYSKLNNVFRTLSKFRMLIIIMLICIIIISIYFSKNSDSFFGRTTNSIFKFIYEKATGEELDTSTVRLDESSSLNEREKEDNNEIKKANTFTLRETYSGNLENKDDIDFFKYDIPHKGILTIHLSNKNELNGGYSIKVYSKDQKEVAEFTSLNDINSNDKITRSVFSTLRVPEGIIYVSVDDYSLKETINTDYELKLELNEEEDIFETEFNDTIKTAYTIKYNSTYIGNLHSEKDIDIYKVEVPKNTLVDVIVKNMKTGVLLGDINVDILGSNGKSKLLKTFSFESKDQFTIDKIRFNKGTYYIKISTKDLLTTGDYVIEVKENTSASKNTR